MGGPVSRLVYVELQRKQESAAAFFEVAPDSWLSSPPPSSFHNRAFQRQNREERLMARHPEICSQPYLGKIQRRQSFGSISLEYLRIRVLLVPS